jgi:hypothetical protein
MDVLCAVLKTVFLEHSTEYAAEARVPLDWLRERITQCPGNQAAYVSTALPAGGLNSFQLSFVYEGRKYFSWRASLTQGHALFEADLGSGRTLLPAAVKLLSPEDALSEAMFF